MIVSEFHVYFPSLTQEAALLSAVTEEDGKTIGLVNISRPIRCIGLH